MRTKKVNTTGQEINVKDVCKLISIFKPKKNNWMLSYTRPSFCIDDMIEQMLTRCLLLLHQNTTEFIAQNYDPNHILVISLCEVIQVNRMRDLCLNSFLHMIAWKGAWKRTD